MRRVAVKAHYVRTSGSSAKAAALHLRYIEREGVEKDGSKGVLYDGDGPVRVGVLEEPRPGEKHQFRIILSPEDGGELDLTSYVRTLMGRIERDLGRKLEWAAVNHYNTGHPHAHLVVRGVDREGREVRFDRAYISNGLRFRAQELATEELGPRRDVDVRRALEKETTQERFTSLDREVERRAEDNCVQVRSGAPRGRVDDALLIGRLEHLEGLGLAERTGTLSWTLTSGWQNRLRELGARGDIIKQMHQAAPGDPSRYRIVRQGQALEPTAAEQPVRVGRVAGKGLSDELKGTYYAILETPAGITFHVPVDAPTVEQMRVGDVVSFTSRPEPAVRPVDREIADAARRGGGVVTLEPSTSTVSSSQARRLRDLERLGLATPESPGRWKVSPKLLDALEERGREAPAPHRVLLRREGPSVEKQVRHPGPVWLDDVGDTAMAPYGFGAGLARALEQRREALVHIGIQRDDPHRVDKLRQLEDQAVGREAAARNGQVLLPQAPDRFRGRVERTGLAESRDSHVIVSDGSRFVVMRATSTLREAQGRSVELARDPQGRLLVRSAERDLGR